MGELLGQIGVLPTSAGGVLVVIFLLMATGRIPTLRELRDAQAREAKAIEREGKAMELANKWQQVASEHGMTLHQILDAVETTNKMVSAIQAGIVHGSHDEPAP